MTTLFCVELRCFLVHLNQGHVTMSNVFVEACFYNTNTSSSFLPERHVSDVTRNKQWTYLYAFSFQCLLS